MKEVGVGICVYYKKGNINYCICCNVYIEGIYDNNEVEYVLLLYGMNIFEELGIKYEVVIFCGDL